MAYDYDKRLRFWTDKSLNQLSFTNNLFLVFSMAFITFSIEKRMIDDVYFTHIYDEIDFDTTFLYISLLFNLLSLFTGLLVAHFRLVDYRTTRHIVFLRLKYYAFKQKEGATEKKSVLSADELEEPEKLSRYLKAIKDSFLPKKFFMSSSELKKIRKGNEYSGKFISLRMYSHIIGELTYTFLNLQMLLFLLAIVLYTFFIF